jgi:hypothetical protein
VYIDDVGNKQVVFGHYQSTRLTKMGLTLLVDRSATAFFTGGPLVEFVERLMDRIPRYYGNRVNEYILDYVKGLCDDFVTTHMVSLTHNLYPSL